MRLRPPACSTRPRTRSRARGDCAHDSVCGVSACRFLAAGGALYVAGPSQWQRRRRDGACVQASQVIAPPVRDVPDARAARGPRTGRDASPRLRPDATRHISALSCARVHFAGGRGLCVPDEAAEAPASGLPSYDRSTAHSLADVRIELAGTSDAVAGVAERHGWLRHDLRGRDRPTAANGSRPSRSSDRSRRGDV